MHGNAYARLNFRNCYEFFHNSGLLFCYCYNNRMNHILFKTRYLTQIFLKISKQNYYSKNYLNNDIDVFSFQTDKNTIKTPFFEIKKGCNLIYFSRIDVILTNGGYLIISTMLPYSTSLQTIKLILYQALMT